MTDKPLTAGAAMQDYKAGRCKKCSAPLIVGLIRVGKGRLAWRNFNAIPLVRNGMNAYTRHACETS